MTTDELMEIIGEWLQTNKDAYEAEKQYRRLQRESKELGNMICKAVGSCDTVRFHCGSGYIEIDGEWWEHPLQQTPIRFIEVSNIATLLEDSGNTSETNLEDLPY